MSLRTVLFLLGAALAVQPLHAQSSEDGQAATAVFAGGCFWCMEPPFDALEGVTATVSGYAGGEVPNPTYEQVSRGGTGHREVLQVSYDPAKVSYEELLEVFWVNVDPFDDGGQFCDRGFQYSPAIYVSSERERELAEVSRQKVEETLGSPVRVEITADYDFYAAEDYHQNYYQEHALKYKYYRWRCGRDARLEEVWGGVSLR